MSDENKGTTQVVRLSSVKEAYKSEFERVDNDLGDLREQMRKDREESELSIGERQQDLEKHTKALDGILERMETAERHLAEHRLDTALGSGRQDLVKEIRSVAEVGYQMPVESDERFKEVRPTFDEGGARQPAKLSVRSLIEGVNRRGLGYNEFKHEDIAELQELNDAALLADAILRGSSEYRNAGGLHSLGIVHDLRAKAEVISKADSSLIDTSDLSNWVPTHFSSRLWSIIKLGLPELGIFPEVVMPGKSLDLNIDLTDSEGQLVSETTTISGANPFADTNAQEIDDDKRTLTAVKLRSRILTSGEVEEDSIVAVLPLARQKLVRNMQEAIAEAIVNGQKTAAIDTATGSIHFGKPSGASMAATDARKAWDGLRYYATSNSATPDTRVSAADAAPTVNTMRSVRATMDEYGVNSLSDLLWLHSVISYLQLLDDDDVATVDKFGNGATVRSGVLAMVDGTELMVSRRLPKNMNASGVIDGTTTDRTSAILVHTGSCVLGNRRRMTIGQDIYGAMDARDIFVFFRGDFTRLFPLTAPWIGELYNQST